MTNDEWEEGMSESDRWVVLDRATVARPGGPVVLRDFSWTIRDGETWAVVGPVGSGKTTLAELLLGRLRLESGAIAWPFLDRVRASGRKVAFPSDAIQKVSFKDDSWLFSYSRHYYQQRFHFAESHEDLTLDRFLGADSPASDDAVRSMAERLGIAALLPLALIKLSNGQARRARIARSLLLDPVWLILDDPFLGLDAAGRTDVANLIESLIREKLHVLLITRRDSIPDWVTNVLELPERSERGTRNAERETIERNAAVVSEPIIELNHVSVAYGDRAILDDISWTVRAGEQWAVVGPNGSGKSTLLSLLCGDHPQAYSNDVRLFGRQRGTGESIWDIKRRIGFVSPELHLHFSEPLTAAETAATGFHDVLVRRPTTPEQDATVSRIFEEFGISELADRPFSRLSTGEQRLVLLIRALVKEPPLLILDEPFQGLDEKRIEMLQNWLGGRLHADQTLLFVSHYPAEIPRTVTQWLRLEKGRLAKNAKTGLAPFR
jgi:molybdate transport system ATP-binding protein